MTVYDSPLILLIRSVLRVRLGLWGTIREDGLHVTRHRRAGVAFRTAVDNPTDIIQRHLASGVFYERRELDRIAGYLRPGDTYVDIGANVGNHALFVALFLKPSKVYVFEPNPSAIRVLRKNVALNGLEDIVVTENLGLGVSDADNRHFALREPIATNLGNAKLIEGEGIVTMSGDTLLRGVDPHFIKIDVEGMEFAVLSGLEKTLKRAGPTVLLEVGPRHESLLRDWLPTSGYRIDQEVRHGGLTNYFLVPITRPTAEDRAP